MLVAEIPVEHRFTLDGFFELSRYRGKMLSIEVDAFPRDLNHISLDDEIKGSEDLYRDLTYNLYGNDGILGFELGTEVHFALA